MEDMKKTCLNDEERANICGPWNRATDDRDNNILIGKDYRIG